MKANPRKVVNSFKVLNNVHALEAKFVIKQVFDKI